MHKTENIEVILHSKSFEYQTHVTKKECHFRILELEVVISHYFLTINRLTNQMIENLKTEKTIKTLVKTFETKEAKSKIFPMPRQ